MHAPRRHSRRLLLPPGWVALGFLLLLGCQALLAHRRQLRQESMLQLTMPYTEAQAKKRHQEGVSYSVMFYMPLSYVSTRRNWHTAQLIGKPMNDFINIELVEKAVRTIQADTSHVGSVRVYLHPGASYASLVYLLDMMNRLNQREYWFDIEHQPATFYIVTRKRSPHAERQQKEKDFYL
jgi:hypothetical protein